MKKKQEILNYKEKIMHLDLKNKQIEKNSMI